MGLERIHLPTVMCAAVDLDPVEVRVLGCLLEKQRTTPDQYPLSLNALRLAANQSTSRDPVTDYDDGAIRTALDKLGHRGWTRLASGPSSRTAKFRHLLDEALRLSRPELALLAVLMLRGPQTAAELRTRGERLHAFGSNEEVEATLRTLAERELVAEGARHRWQQLLDADAPPAQAAAPATDLEARVEHLEALAAQLAERVEALER
jgi:uncharacterized protein YceH (UPF0502 family)